jgi:hypothetical protein
MKKILILFLALCIMTVGVSAAQLDYADLGDAASETAHNAQGWLPFFDGGYGGRDGLSTIAMVWGEGGFCNQNNNDATIELDAGSGTATKILIRHFDGSSNDSFEVYLGNDKIGSYADQYPDESPSNWQTMEINVSFTGEKTLRIVATGPAGVYCAYHQNPDYYGQVAINWIELQGTTQIPEFGTIAALVALAGAVTAFLVLRKS